MKKGIKISLITLGSIIGLLLVTVIGYVVFLQLNYYRIEDNLSLDISNNQSGIVATGTEYTAVTYNIGFGAYDQEYSFFMDTGVMLDGTEVQGIYGTARSKEAAQINTDGAVSTALSLDPDFLLLQEVDVKATRSYDIDQKAAFEKAFPSWGSFFGSNFHSVFLFYPFHDPHGSVEAGLLSFSKYEISSATRRSYPVTDNFVDKLFDLDRAFTVSRYETDKDAQLVIINSHMSAYDEGGTIRERQLQLLNEIMTEEYNKGNYVIVGGDFNHVLGEKGETFTSQMQLPEWIAKLDNNDLAEHFAIAEAINQTEIPTCRSADIPYEKGVNYTAVIDGFIISDNITATAENIDADFMYSDHNPVKLSFVLE